MALVVSTMSAILTLVRTTVGGLTGLWVFAVAVAFFVIGLAIRFIGGLLNKRGGRRRK